MPSAGCHHVNGSFEVTAYVMRSTSTKLTLFFSSTWLSLLAIDPDTAFPNLKADTALAAPCTEDSLSRALPATDVAVLARLISLVFIDRLFQQCDPCGKLVRPRKA